MGYNISFNHNMGILNVTPDSFSDGGLHFKSKNALSHAETLIKDGASILDIGAESTKPGAKPVSFEEEKIRLEPVLAQLNTRTHISIDTQKAAIADWALRELKIDIINDVSAFSDPEMPQVIGEHQASVVIMHMQGTPETMQDNPQYDNVIDTLLAFFETKINVALKHKISNIILDPGIGFGKHCATIYAY